jgi:hypothetical protein
MDAGFSFEESMRKAMKPILISPFFLYRVEVDRAGPAIHPVNHFELATRLSYFIWGSMPDEELFAVARDGKLASDGHVLEAQIQRMLDDPKARALTDIFAAQWLQLNHLDHALPKEANFPGYDHHIREAMRQETLLFFDRIRRENLSILEIVSADWTYVNGPLAKFYGMSDAGVRGEEMQLVQMGNTLNRGGILGHGSVLSMTSHVDRTKPSARGQWILDVVMGTPPPPPPPDAGNFQVNEGGEEAATFREKLDMHANTPGCAGCHAKIDPLGFALEDFNAVGQWRDRSAGVDNEGVLPSGEKVYGFNGLKQIMASREEEFTRNLVVRMFTYALGREVMFTDELAIRRAVEKVEEADHKFNSLVREIVFSRPFLYRKNNL